MGFNIDMNRPVALLVFVLFATADQSAAQPKVDVKGVASKVVVDEVIFGHLHALDGKFKMRAIA